MGVRVGDWVEVKSKELIIATLDGNGELDGMPFMPEMLQYCGQRFQVYKSAHKTCDTLRLGHSRSLSNAVHLSTRCDGKMHGGCGAACLIFWKSEWLRPVDGPNAKHDSVANSTSAEVVDGKTAACTVEDVLKAARNPNSGEGGVERYSCQITRLLEFTSPLSRFDQKQYVRDYSSGNVGLMDIVRGAVVDNVVMPMARRSRVFCSAYNQFQNKLQSIPIPVPQGRIALGSSQPMVHLGLQPGELVRVKRLEEIEATLNVKNMNRGMGFDIEMVRYCGKVFRVKSRVEKFLDENSGEVRQLSTPAVILEGVWCQGRHSAARMHCPRSIYCWWREIWLERVESSVA